MPGKLDLASRSAIEPHRVTWYDALPKAMAVLIVGAAYNPEDSHIWKPILSSSARIGVVDPCAEAMVERIKADGHQNAYAVANAFDETALPRMKTFLQAP
jgi:hypothetical protein